MTLTVRDLRKTTLQGRLWDKYQMQNCSLNSIDKAFEETFDLKGCAKAHTSLSLLSPNKCMFMEVLVVRW